MIDGYNLLGRLGLLGEDHADISLLARLDRFCVLNRHFATVVFDSLPHRESPSTFSFGNRVTVKVAPPGTGPDRADRVIISLVQNPDSGDGICVVTDDRELITTVRNEGTNVVRCREFVEMMDRTSDSSPDSDDKEQAARKIDNSEFLRIWSGHVADNDSGRAS